MTTAVVKPSIRIASPNASRAAIWPEKCSGASSQPSRSAMVAWTVGSPDQRLVSRSKRRSAQAPRRAWSMTASRRPWSPDPRRMSMRALIRSSSGALRRRSGARPGARPDTGPAGRQLAAFDREDLLEAPPVARLAAELGPQEGDRAFDGRLDADDP